MRVIVRWGYRGKPSNGRYIKAGEYDADDPALFGLSEYLIQNGHALKVEEAVIDPPPEHKPTPKRRKRRTTKRANDNDGTATKS